jgi:hypothetical protein
MVQEFNFGLLEVIYMLIIRVFTTIFVNYRA